MNNESIRSIAKHHGIPQSTFFSRLALGMSLEEAVNFKPKFTKVVNAIEYKSKRDYVESLGINYSTYRSRKARGWTEAQALSGF